MGTYIVLWKMKKAEKIRESNLELYNFRLPETNL